MAARLAVPACLGQPGVQVDAAGWTSRALAVQQICRCCGHQQQQTRMRLSTICLPVPPMPQIYNVARDLMKHHTQTHGAQRGGGALASSSCGVGTGREPVLPRRARHPGSRTLPRQLWTQRPLRCQLAQRGSKSAAHCLSRGIGTSHLPSPMSAWPCRPGDGRRQPSQRG